MPASNTESDPERVETPEELAALGWERLTFSIGDDPSPAGEVAEWEIMQDPEGRLWRVTDWHRIGGNGIRHRAERRRITRPEAVAMVARASIPDAFHGDFRECLPGPERMAYAARDLMAFVSLIQGAAEDSRPIPAGAGNLGGRLFAEFFDSVEVMEG